MTRRMTVLVAGAAVAALGLTACSGGSGSGTAAGGASSGDSAKKVTSIKLVAAEYSKDHTAAFWKPFADKYKAKTGNTLDVQIVSWDTIDQQSSTMIQNNHAPDILNLNAYASYAKDGLLYSSDEVLSPAVKSDMLDTFVKYGTYQGKFYGFPDLSSARALFYNKALFSQAGIAAPPKTWDEFEADAKKIQALGGGNVGYAMPLGPEEAQGEFSIWLFNNGGDWKTDGKWIINSHKNVETLAFLKKLAVHEKVTQNNPARTNRADAFDLFKSGNAGMVVGFTPLAADLDKDKKVDYGVAPFPVQRRHREQDLRCHRLPHGLQEAGQPGGRQGLLRPLLPARPGQHLHQGRGLPAGHQDRPRGVRVLPEAQGLPRHPAQREADADRRPHAGTRSSSPSSRTSGRRINGDPKATLDALQKTAENGG